MTTCDHGPRYSLEPDRRPPVSARDADFAAMDARPGGAAICWMLLAVFALAITTLSIVVVEHGERIVNNVRAALIAAEQEAQQ